MMMVMTTTTTTTTKKKKKKKKKERSKKGKVEGKEEEGDDDDDDDEKLAEQIRRLNFKIGTFTYCVSIAWPQWRQQSAISPWCVTEEHGSIRFRWVYSTDKGQQKLLTLTQGTLEATARSDVPWTFTPKFQPRIILIGKKRHGWCHVFRRSVGQERTLKRTDGKATPLIACRVVVCSI